MKLKKINFTFCPKFNNDILGVTYCFGDTNYY